MKVRVRLFSIFRDAAGAGFLEVHVEGPLTVRTLIEMLYERFPKLMSATKIVEPIVLVNGAAASHDLQLNDGDEVALIPPASGGSGRLSVALFKSDEELNLAKRLERFNELAREEGVGALAIFVGLVKGFVEGHRVYELYYEAYEEAALRALHKIAEEALDEGVKFVEVMHRVGPAKPGEKTLYIAVAATNRRKALEALSKILERVKSEPPIFKLERREDGDYYLIGDRGRVKKLH